MPAVRIHDLDPNRDALSVDLRHLILLLGERAISSCWRVRDVWATGDATEELEALDESMVLSGAQLLSLSQKVVQIIDGVFSAFDSDLPSPWVVVEACDSTFFAVHSDDDSVIALIRNSFENVVPHEYPIM